jgi:phosphoribosyl 1,2-cyclic phosphodiesterase
MIKNMEIKFWGVRGSLPFSYDTLGWARHSENVLRSFFSQGYRQEEHISQFISQQPVTRLGGFGTATTCVEVHDGNSSLIIDGGSGIKSISDQMQFTGSNVNEYHILITHFHFDHIIGLPFFMPHFRKGCVVNYYSVQSETESIIRGLFSKPSFPVTFESLNAEIRFHHLTPHRPRQINGFTVTPYQTDHPDTCYGYRVEKGGKSYAHAVDNEGTRLSRAHLGADGGLYEKADLVFFDAQYEEADMGVKKGWGHGTCDRGFEICSNFGARQILFAHHEPSFSIDDTLKQINRAHQAFSEKYPNSKLMWDFAYEGMKVKL